MQVVNLYDHPSFPLSCPIWERSRWNPVDPFPSAYQTLEGVLLCWTRCLPVWITLAVLELFPTLEDAKEYWRSLDLIPHETKGAK